MIRRTIRTAAGAEQWVLISQLEHARLAGELAEAWGREGFAELAPRGELLQAIFHHDDGWAAWERSIDVDAETGRPRQFTEMPLALSLAIWQASIASADEYGALAGYVVSAHFCALLRRFSSRWQDDAAMTALAQEFLARQEQQQASWRQAWIRQAAVGDPAAALAEALRFLQLFDSLSLWLCCCETPEPETFEPPSGPPIAVRLQAPGEVALGPWPFQPERLKLEAAGRAIPAARYETPAALANAPGQSATLRWELFPSVP